MNILKRIRKLISLYEKRKRLRNARKIYSKTSVSNNLSKTIISDGVNIELNSKSNELIEKVQKEIENIAAKTDCNPEELLKYAKASGVSVHIIPNAENILKNIGEHEGFIPEKRGFNGLFLSIITMSGIKFHSDDMFIFGKPNPEKYLVLYNFYKWFSKKQGLSGFDSKAQELFKKYYKNSSKLSTKGLNLEEIVGLQDAISREKEAINYTLNYEKEHEVSKKLSEKISKDNGTSI